MVADGTYTAVLDRFEVTDSDVELAVLLLESDGETVDELTLPRDRVPDAGQHPDAVFDVTIVDGGVQKLDYRPDETSERGEDVRSRFDRLSERPPDADRSEE